MTSYKLLRPETSVNKEAVVEYAELCEETHKVRERLAKLERLEKENRNKYSMFLWKPQDEPYKSVFDLSDKHLVAILEGGYCHNPKTLSIFETIIEERGLKVSPSLVENCREREEF